MFRVLFIDDQLSAELKLNAEASCSPPLQSAYDPPGTPEPEVQVSRPIRITEDLAVERGEALFFRPGYPDDAQGIQIGDSQRTISGEAIAVTNLGTITVLEGKVYGLATGIANDGFITAPVSFNNARAGKLYVEATGVGSFATGIDSNFYSINVDNAGLIQVVSLDGGASGYLGGGNELRRTDFFNRESGEVVVWAKEAAYGVSMGVGNTDGMKYQYFKNAGLIDVYGREAYGVRNLSHFDNSGTIRATTTTGEYLSVAVSGSTWDDKPQINSGVVQGDIAFYWHESYWENDGYLVLENSGEIYGHIVAGVGNSSITNTGLIVGDIAFDDGDAVYAGANGQHAGHILLGVGANLVSVGSEGDAVYGGMGGSSTVIGGQGDDFLQIMRGDFDFDGGGGLNTLSFETAATAVVVDLGQGTSSAAGSGTFSGVSRVIGSDLGDRLTAGAQGAALFGWSGADSLTGGVGNDTLVGGAGGDRITTGDGLDLVIYSQGDGGVLITDFQLGSDQLQIFGHSGSYRVEQRGQDAVVFLGDGDRIELRGVDALSLGATSLTVSAAPYVWPSMPGSLPKFGTSFIELNRDMHIARGERLHFDPEQLAAFNQGFDTARTAFVARNMSNDLFADLENGGQIDISVRQGPLYGMLTDGGGFGGGQGGRVVNSRAGRFSVESGSGNATGIYGEGFSGGIDNAGRYSVVSGAVATGVECWSDPDFDDLVVNRASGRMAISGGESATGVRLHNSGSIDNDGVISVTAAGAAFGIRTDGGVDFNNSGLLEVTSTEGAAAYGLLVEGVFQYSIVNTGTIRAKTAISVAEANDANQINIDNAGRVEGDILIGQADEHALYGTLRSTGDIVGDVRVLNASGTIDLRGGHHEGRLEIVASGDTSSINNIYTGDEDTEVRITARHLGDGNTFVQTIHGGKGLVQVRYNASASEAQIVANLDGSYSVSTQHDGTATLFAVDRVRFNDQVVKLEPIDPMNYIEGTDRADVIKGTAEADFVRAANGNDLVDGAAGDDLLLGGYGWDTLEGSDGNDTLEGGDAQLESDVLRGGAGRDLLIAGTSREWMEGGEGDDTFSWASIYDSYYNSGNGLDIISDLSATDVIDLSAIDADGDSSNGDTAFVLTDRFHGRKAELVVFYDLGAGRTLIEGDIGGFKNPLFRIWVEGHHEDFDNFVL